MTTLGQKLRELRHQKGYRLNEVAEGADLSISFISLIERDKASISVENLQKLANFYKVRLFEIFQDIEEEEAYIVRHAQVNERDLQDISNHPMLFMLSPDDNLTFRSFLAYIPPATANQEIQLKKGEAFLMIREGSLEVELHNKKPVTLYQGDTIHMTSFRATHLKNASGSDPVHLLIVTSPTTQHLNIKGDSLHLQAI